MEYITQISVWKKINASLIAYIIVLVFMTSVPLKKFELTEESTKIIDDKIVIIAIGLLFALYYSPYILEMKALLSLKGISRKSYFYLIESISFVKYFLDMFIVLSIYKTERSKTKFLRYFAIALFSLQIIFDFGMGRRREMFLSFVYLAPLLVVKFQNSSMLRKFIMVLGSLYISILLFVTPLVRMGHPISLDLFRNLTTYILGWNDFIAPFQTLAFEMDHTNEFLLLSSYTKGVLRILEDVFKFDLNVIYTMEGLMYRVAPYIRGELVGWTYTPITESYISFGYAGIYGIFPVFNAVLFYVILNTREFTLEKVGFFLMLYYQYFRGDFANFVPILFFCIVARAFFIKWLCSDRSYNIQGDDNHGWRNGRVIRN